MLITLLGHIQRQKEKTEGSGIILITWEVFACYDLHQ